MSDDESPLARASFASSPFRRRHAEAGRLHASAFECRPPTDLLYGGIHGIRWPTLSLAAYQVLGPVRHALSQRVVAGTHEVRFVPVLRPPTPKKDKG